VGNRAAEAGECLVNCLPNIKWIPHQNGAKTGKTGDGSKFVKLAHMRIPDDADQRSGMMPITIPF